MSCSAMDSTDKIESKAHFHIRIGVTGHRDIENIEKIKNTINRVLTETIVDILSPIRLEAATPLSYSILTSLAEGADRIVAECGKETLNAKIETVLPASENDYIATFSSPSAINEFHLLVRNSFSVKTVSTDFSDKSRAFKKCGEYIVDNSDLIIAILDNSRPAKSGGTRETVDYARRKDKTIVLINPKTPSLFEIERGSNRLAECFNQYEEFNRFYLNSNCYEERLTHEKNIFLPEDKYRYDEKQKEAVIKHLLPIYVRAASISAEHQKLYKSTGTLVHTLSPIAVSTVAFGIFFHSLSWLFFSLEFVLLLLILVSIKRADKKKAHENWIQTRYLAELVRNSIYMTISGIKPSKIKTSYLSNLAHSPEDWMVRIYDDTINLLPESLFLTKPNRQLNEYVASCWIQNQIDFHFNKSTMAHKISSRLEILGLIVFSVALLSAGLHVLLSTTGFEYQFITIANFLTFAAIVLPALGSSFGAIRNHREYSRLIKRSHNMALLLEGLKTEFSTPLSVEEFEALVYEAEGIMLQETQDWLTLMKFTKLEAA